MRRAAATIAGRLARAGEASSSRLSRAALLRPALVGASDAMASAAAAGGATSRALGTATAPSFAAASDADLSNFAVFYPEPEAEVGEAAPSFSLPAIVNGEVKDVSLEDYKGKYVLLFFYPKDFTFVCPTEIIAFSDRAKEFEALNCQVLACSTDTPEVHLAWIKTARKRGGLGYMQIPILADVTKAVSARFGTLKRDAGIALRGLYIINPEGVLEHITVNNFPIGRNVDEALRTLQAIQYVAEHGEVCPAGWQPGDKTMVADPERSLDYFGTLDEAEEATREGARLVKVHSKKELDAVLAGNSKVAIKFWAPWCNKCRMLAPHVDELAEKHPGVTVVSFDTTEESLEAVAADMGVKGLPQFRFFKDGKETLEKIMGYKLAPLGESFKKLEGL